MEAIRGKIDLQLRGYNELANAGEAGVNESMDAAAAAAIDTSNSDAEQELWQATDTESATENRNYTRDEMDEMLRESTADTADSSADSNMDPAV